MLFSNDEKSVPRCQIVPQPGHRVSFQIDGNERLAWNFNDEHPRPFLYPLIGPAGRELTRIGHPGAPNHDHHLSIWFAHNKVGGKNFWSNDSTAFIKQEQWLAYNDGERESAMAVRLGWFDGIDPAPVLKQDLVVSINPSLDHELSIEIDTTFTPMAEQLELQQSTLGPLAVRVAASISEFFGQGLLTNSNGQQGEKAIFGKPAEWVDYSGPVFVNDNQQRPSSEKPEVAINGITYFDHPQNPSFPSGWHVREDGWMACSATMNSGIMLTRENPLRLRYMLRVHNGEVNVNRTAKIAFAFRDHPGWVVKKSKRKHREYDLQRES